MAEKERFDTTYDDVVDERTFKQKVRDSWNGFKVWCGNHKEVIVISIPILGAVGKEMLKAHRNNERIKAEDEKHMRTIYDASHKHWIVTAKDIKPKQQRIIDARHDAGESYYDILDDLGIKVIR